MASASIDAHIRETAGPPSCPNTSNYLLDVVHEVHGGGAGLLLGVAAAERVHDVAGEDEEEVRGAAVADGSQRAQHHEQDVHPVGELEQAPDAPPLAGAPGACRVAGTTHLLAGCGSNRTSQ